MVKQINENMIREAAYFLWEKAGRPDGSAEYFWMKACEQFFNPKKVEIKKPAAKKTCSKKVCAAKKEVATEKKPVVKVTVKPATAKAQPVKKVVIKVQDKPAKKSTATKAATAPFYGSRK